MSEESDRRGEFIADCRGVNPFLYGDGVPRPLVEMSARAMRVDDPRREKVVAALDADIDRQTERNKSTPLRLSDAALRSLGISPAPKDGAA